MKLNPNTLKNMRQQAGMTQKDLSSAAGVPYSTLTKLEQGKIPSPSIDIAAKLAGALSCTVDDMLDTKVKKLHKNPDIKFVYFDVGGVLVHWLLSIQAFAERIDRPYDTVLKIFYEYLEAGTRGEITEEDLQMLFLLKLKVKFTPENKESLFKPWIIDMRPILPTHDFIRRLAKVHSVGLLTNVFKGYYPDFFEYGLVPDIKYKALVKSCDLGVIKPEPKIYEIAAQAAGVKPEEILFFDDRKTNVKVARDMGWQAEWFDEYHPQESIDAITKKYFSG